MKVKRILQGVYLIVFCVILITMVACSAELVDQDVAVNDAEVDSDVNADDPLKEKMISCGELTDDEIESICETMNNCGIYDIEKVERVISSGNLKTVVTVLGESHGFNVGLEDGEVWYIEATGVASSKTVIYQNFFGAIRSKTVGSTTTADMFYEGEYLLYFIEEENKLVDYENRPDDCH